MKKSKIILIGLPLLIILLYFLSAGNSTNGVMQKNVSDSLNGWTKGETVPHTYEIGRDSSINFEGKAPLYLKSVSNLDSGFGTILKYVKAKEYIGKRLRLSGFIKTENIDAWAGMWMRIDAVIPGKMLGFDNMRNRPITGTTDWSKYEIVLDVPEKSNILWTFNCSKRQGVVQ
jgi:hypothetical protein